MQVRHSCVASASRGSYCAEAISYGVHAVAKVREKAA